MSNRLGTNYNSLSPEEKLKLVFNGAKPPWMPAWDGDPNWNGITVLSKKYKHYISINGEI